MPLSVRGVLGFDWQRMACDHLVARRRSVPAGYIFVTGQWVASAEAVVQLLSINSCARANMADRPARWASCSRTPRP
jgi:hypothetical protein